MIAGERVAEAARCCVGARFRLGGREPATGLDCVGVATFALRAGGWRGAVPSGYALRGGEATTVAAAMDRGLERCDAGAVGAVLLLRAGPGQLHLAVGVPGGCVHADAALRRVVERPGTLPWPVLGAWQIRER